MVLVEVLSQLQQLLNVPYQHVLNVILRGILESDVLVGKTFSLSNLNCFWLCYRALNLR